MVSAFSRVPNRPLLTVFLVTLVVLFVATHATFTAEVSAVANVLNFGFSVPTTSQTVNLILSQINVDEAAILPEYIAPISQCSIVLDTSLPGATRNCNLPTVSNPDGPAKVECQIDLMSAVPTIFGTISCTLKAQQFIPEAHVMQFSLESNTPNPSEQTTAIRKGVYIQQIAGQNQPNTNTNEFSVDVYIYASANTSSGRALVEFEVSPGYEEGTTPATPLYRLGFIPITLPLTMSYYAVSNRYRFLAESDTQTKGTVRYAIRPVVLAPPPPGMTSICHQWGATISSSVSSSKLSICTSFTGGITDSIETEDSLVVKLVDHIDETRIIHQVLPSYIFSISIDPPIHPYYGKLPFTPGDIFEFDFRGPAGSVEPTCKLHFATTSSLVVSGYCMPSPSDDDDDNGNGNGANEVRTICRIDIPSQPLQYFKPGINDAYPASLKCTFKNPYPIQGRPTPVQTLLSPKEVSFSIYHMALSPNSYLLKDHHLDLPAYVPTPMLAAWADPRTVSISISALQEGPSPAGGVVTIRHRGKELETHVRILGCYVVLPHDENDPTSVVTYGDLLGSPARRPSNNHSGSNTSDLSHDLYYFTIPSAPLPLLVDCLTMSFSNDIPISDAIEVSFTYPTFEEPFVTSLQLNNIDHIRPYHPTLLFLSGANIIYDDNTSPTLNHGESFGVYGALEFPAGSYLLPDDHIILSGDVFGELESLTCLVTHRLSAMTSSCVFDVDHPLQDNDHIGPHLVCSLPHPDQDHVPPEHSTDSIQRPSVYAQGVLVDVRCTAVMSTTQLTQSTHGLEMVMRVYADQQQKPTADQYAPNTIKSEWFPLDDSVAGKQTVSIEQPEYEWMCTLTLDDDEIDGGGNSLPVSCTSRTLDDYQHECQQLATQLASSDCELSCTVNVACHKGWDVESIIEDAICIEYGLPKPYMLRTVVQPCSSCHPSAGGSNPAAGRDMYGVDCAEPPSFTLPLVSSLGASPLRVILANQKPIDTDSVGELILPDHVEVYHVEIQYDTSITLTWSFTGLTTTIASLYIKSPSITPFQELFVLTIPASAQTVTFRLDAMDVLRDVSMELQDVVFDLRIGQYPVDLDATFAGREDYVVLQVQPRCVRWEPITPDQTSFFCANNGECQPATGECTCPEGFFGVACQDQATPHSILCDELQCVTENTYAMPTDGHSHGEECIPIDNDDDDNDIAVEDGISTLKCNCLPEYTGEYCEHERICEHHGCTYGRLVSPTGEPEACECECNNTFITGSTCNQCGLPCRNGGVVNGRCTQCQCKAGYIGDVCQIPVWYHSFTLRNLPQHIVKMILDVSSSSSSSSSSSQAQLLAILRDTMVKLLLDDYSRALRDTFIIVDDANGEGGGDGSEDGSDGNDSRIRVRVELSQFQTVVPPANPNAPYVYIQLMLYPADMTDEMLAYAQQHGLVFDWSRITNNLDFFKQFLREQGIIDENGDDGIVPEIDDPGCTTRKCHEPIVDEESSNAAFSLASCSTLFISLLLSISIISLVTVA